LRVALFVGVALCLPGSACDSSSTATTVPTRAAAPAAHPPTTLAARLDATDTALRGLLDTWQRSDPGLRRPPPAGTLALAAREREAVSLLARRRVTARRTLAALPRRLRAAVHSDLVAARDLRRLTGPPSPALRLVPAPPAGRLLADYRLAQRRFGVPWQVLAAVNLVETAFGRVVNRSSAGARGPMQFMPSTWQAYGLGGDISSPRDAVLGAANYLRRSGAPADERRALYAYNPSRLYVQAVLAYAGVMRRDPLGFLTYYAWEASLPR
jgi:hypothetical protein